MTYGLVIDQFALGQEVESIGVDINLCLCKMCPLVDECSILGSGTEKSRVGSKAGDCNKGSMSETFLRADEADLTEETSERSDFHESRH